MSTVLGAFRYHHKPQLTVEDITNLLTEISTEIDDQYEDNDYAESPSEITPLIAPKSPTLNPLSFVPVNNYMDEISELFCFTKQLGQGASSKVLLANLWTNANKVYALKELQQSDPKNRRLFANECNILRKLAGHQNIVSLHSAFVDKEHFYISTEYCSGGTMLDKIIQSQSFSESQCVEFIKSVLNGIKWMHSKNIVHRDLKCQNLVFDKDGKDGVVKLIDFGSSEIISNMQEVDQMIVGSLYYLPPELLTGEIRTKETLFKGDMWAIGVVCYILVSGHVPFMGKDREQTLELIKRGKVRWPRSTKNLSSACKHFIRSLLCVDISKRLSCDEALKHEWICDKGKASKNCFGDLYLQQIEFFSTANKLQKILLNAVFCEMDKKEKQKLLKTLRDLDLNLDKNEVINHILITGQIDVNGNEITQKNEKTKYGQNINDYDGLVDDLLTEILQNEQQNEMKHDDLKFIDEPSDESEIKCDEIHENLNDFDSFPHTKMVKKISVPRFCHIMEHTEKDYDIQALVNSLAPTPSGHIRMSSINTFDGVIRSRGSICKMMDDMVDNIAKEYFNDDESYLDSFIEID